MGVCPFDVIRYNDEEVYKSWNENDELIKGCTPSPLEVTQKAGGTKIPYYNPFVKQLVKKITKKS